MQYEITRAQVLVEDALKKAPDVARPYDELPFFRRKRELDVSLLSSAARSLDIKVTPLGKELVRLERDGRVLFFFQNMSSSLSMLDRLVTNDKILTKEILAGYGLPVARGKLVTSSEDAVRAQYEMAQPVVLKPLSGSGGRGVTVGVRGADQVAHAAEVAFAKSSRILVEECIDAVDLRVMVAGGQAIAVQMRVPANVVGNGVRTIAELIDEKNSERRKNAYLRSGLIHLDESLVTQLAWRGIRLNDVPAPGQRVFLHFKANLSSGGDNIALEGCVHPGLLRLAERSLEPFSTAYHAGVDLLVEAIDKGPEDQRCVVCEINCNNEHPIHLYPAFGEPLDAAGLMLERYFSPHFDEFIGRAGESPGRGERMEVIPPVPASSNVTELISYAGLVGRGSDKDNLVRRSVCGIDLNSIGRYVPELRIGKYSRSLLKVGDGRGLRVVEPASRTVFSTVAVRPLHLYKVLSSNGIPCCSLYHFKGASLDDASRSFSLSGPWDVMRRNGKKIWWQPVVSVPALKRLWRQFGSGAVTVRESSLDVRMRALVVGHECVAWVALIPPHVVGNGFSSVEALINEKKMEQRKVAEAIGISRKRDLGSPRNLRRFNLDPSAILPVREIVSLGRSSLPEYGGDIVPLSRCPDAGLYEMAEKVVRCIGRPGMAAVGFAVRHYQGSKSRSWVVEEVDLQPELAQFEAGNCSTGTEGLYQTIGGYLANLSGYDLDLD